MKRKLILLCATLIFGCFKSFAQAPANDICADAILLNVNSGWTATSNANTVTNGPNPSCGGSSAIRDIWFKFVYGGGTVTIETQLGTNSDTRIAVFSSCGGTQIACNDDNGSTYASRIILSCAQLTIGSTYIIQAGGYNSIVGTFDIGITASGILGCTDPAATNYSVCAAENDGSCVFPTLTAQFQYAPTGSSCLDIQYASTSSGNIVAYSWAFPGGTPSSSTLQNPVVTYPSAGVYSATLTIIDPSNNTSTSTNNNVQVVTGEIVTVDITPDANPNQTSWKMFDEDNVIVAQGTSNDATFCIADACHRFEIYDSGNNGLTGAGQYRIYLNGIEAASGAGFAGLDIRYVNCPDGISCNEPLTAALGVNDVPFDNSWYVFTPMVNGQYRISTCDLAACDTRIWVYDYCMMANFDDSNEATYTYNDDLCGVQAEAAMFMTGGNTYYVRVGSSGSCSGMSYDVLFEYVGAITGCMDELACNYSPLAGEPAPCYYNDDPNCTGLGPDLEVSLPDFYNSLFATTITSNDACLVNEGCLQGLGNRKILRFTTKISNIGTEDYFIGVPNANNSQFEFDQCHNHYHYEGYAEYLLYNQEGEPMPQIGFKNGFCVLDLSCPSGIQAQYSCGNMGITAGCADIYSSGLSCQWIDITDVPGGDYYLVIRTNWGQNPDQNGSYELRYDNNWAQVCIHFDKDVNGNIINFTKNISSCPIIEDCVGQPFGDDYADCAGNCPGMVIRGDVNQDDYFTMADEHAYAEAAVYGGITVSPCTDLNNDGEITVADAAYAGECIHTQADMGVPPLLYDECAWDDEFLDQNENVTLGITNLNTTESYFDLYIINPDNEIAALQVDFSGAIISSVENLLPGTTWNAHLHPEVGGNSLAALGDNHTYIPINVSATPILRIYYSSLTSNSVCVSNIVDVLNDFLHNVLTGFGDCVSAVEPVTADFSASQTSICSGQSVTFTDLSIGNPTSWSWTFIGGSPSSSILQNPTITYSSAGVYSVVLTATGPGGSDFETKTAYITVGSSVVWYQDADSDGYGNPTITQSACTQPVGYVAIDGDCDDVNNAIHPDALEVCNGSDDNCDGSTDEGFDQDNDGVTVCEGDCDDNNALQYPGAFELCNNQDDDCDGTVDEGFDQDMDNYTVCDGDCDDLNADINPAAEEVCNGVDDDCDGDTDEGFDFDNDGYSICNGDCDDTNASIHPAFGEQCNGVDDNCNGTTDEGYDTDGDGYTTCEEDCDDTNAAIHPGAVEICNGQDDNCNGDIDEGLGNTWFADADGDGYGNAALISQACAAPAGYVAQAGDCDDGNNAVHPGVTELCNNTDDNCDGNVDEGYVNIWYQDSDNDGYGNPLITSSACTTPVGYVATAGDCNDDNAAVNPGATEVCGNSIDENCNGQVNEGCPAVINDWRQYAITLVPAQYNSCSSVTASLSLATPSPEAQSTALTGQDLWYKFVALTPGVRVRVITSAVNALIELQDEAGNMIDQENLQSTKSSEILNFANLTVGQTYYVAVRNYNSAQGTGSFSICLTRVNASGCNSAPGPYTLCGTFKAIAVNASSYIFNFTSTTTNITYSRAQASTSCILSNVQGLPWGDTYDVRIDASYSLTLGNNTTETMIIPGPVCEMIMVSETLLTIAPSLDCPSPRVLGTYIKTNNLVCAPLNYEWEFQLDDLSEPVFYYSGGMSRYCTLTEELGFEPGETYNVRHRVTYTNNYVGPWGPLCCLLISGSGMPVTGEPGFLEQEAETRAFEVTDFFVYPNPNSGYSVNFVAEGLSKGELTVWITDVTGRIVLSRSFVVEEYLNGELIFEHPLSPGIYLIEMIHAGMHVTKRMVVEK